MDGLRVHPDGDGPIRSLPVRAQRPPAIPAKTLSLRALLSGGVLFTATFLLALAGAVGAQDRDTVFDRAGVLTDAEEVRVQQALDEASARTDEPHYLFFISDGDTPEEVPEGEGRRDLLRAEAEEIGAPDESGIVVVAPDDNWALVSPEVENAQGVFEVMRPELQDRSYAEAAIIGAGRISDDATVVPEVAGFGAEFTEASSLFTTNPREALARIQKGNRLLDGALASLARAENVLDRHRQAPPKARHAEEE